MAGYGGTIDQQRDIAVNTINIFSGVWNTNGHQLTGNAYFTQSGGTFNASTSYMVIGGMQARFIGGTFNANSAELVIHSFNVTTGTFYANSSTIWSGYELT